MGSSIVRNILGALALIILSFIIGIMAADSAKQAAIIIIGIVGIAGVVAIGKNAWMLLFIIVPIGQAFPVYQLPWYFVFVAILLIYWCFLAIAGHAHFTWRKLLGADLFVLTFLAYMAITIYRHPASSNIINNFLGIKTDLVTTGLEYPLCVAALIFYLAYSCIPFEKKYFQKVIHWGVILKLVFLFLAAIAGYNSQVEETGISLFDSAEPTPFRRFGMFTTFAFNLSVFVYGSASFRQIILSHTKVFLLFLSLVLVLLSGYRNRLLRLGIIMMGTMVIKKEYWIIITCIVTIVFSVLFLNITNATESLPITVQRVLAGVPGVQVNKRLKIDTSGSNEWRYVMWKWALDSRTNYIHDYVWGDGCTLDTRVHQRNSRSIVRKQLNPKTQEYGAQIRAWHSGFIRVLQELGIIGLSLTFIGHIYAFIMTIRIGTALRKTAYLKYFLVYTYNFIQSIITFYILPASTQEFLISLAHFAFIKVFYHLAESEGLISPLFSNKKRYTPMLIQRQTGQSA